MTKSKALAEIAELKFRPLKKALQKSYKKIRFSLQDDRLPDARVFEQFMMETVIMVSYAGFGDEYYEGFRAACLDMEKAYKKNDLDLFQAKFNRVKELRQQCHEKFRPENTL